MQFEPIIKNVRIGKKRMFVEIKMNQPIPLGMGELWLGTTPLTGKVNWKMTKRDLYPSSGRPSASIRIVQPDDRTLQNFLLCIWRGAPIVCNVISMSGKEDIMTTLVGKTEIEGTSGEYPILQVEFTMWELIWEKVVGGLCGEIIGSKKAKEGKYGAICDPDGTWRHCEINADEAVSIAETIEYHMDEGHITASGHKKKMLMRFVSFCEDSGGFAITTG